MAKTNSDRAQFDKNARELLFKTIPKLKSAQEAEIFLKDIMSSSEIKDLARRLMSVKSLYSGQTYQEVNLAGGMSMGTINKMHFKTKGSKILPNLLS